MTLRGGKRFQRLNVCLETNQNYFKHFIHHLVVFLLINNRTFLEK